MSRYNESDLDREFQKLRVLAGEIGASAKHALRRGDLFPADSRVALIPQMRSAPAAGSAPTKAEFDALVADVHAIVGALQSLRDRVS